MLPQRYQRSVDSGGAALRAAIEVCFHLPWPQSRASLDHTWSSAKDEKALSRDIKAKLLFDKGSHEVFSAARSIVLSLLCPISCHGHQRCSRRTAWFVQAGDKEEQNFCKAPASSKIFLEAAYRWLGKWGSPSMSAQHVPSTIHIAIDISSYMMSCSACKAGRRRTEEGHSESWHVFPSNHCTWWSPGFLDIIDS